MKALNYSLIVALDIRDRLQSVIEQLDRTDLRDELPTREAIRTWLRSLDQAQGSAQELADEMSCELDQLEDAAPEHPQVPS